MTWLFKVLKNQKILWEWLFLSSILYFRISCKLKLFLFFSDKNGSCDQTLKVTYIHILHFVTTEFWKNVFLHILHPFRWTEWSKWLNLLYFEFGKEFCVGIKLMNEMNMIRILIFFNFTSRQSCWLYLYQTLRQLCFFPMKTWLWFWESAF